VNNDLDKNLFLIFKNFQKFIFFSAEVLDEQNRIYTKEDDRFLALKLRACVKTKKTDEKVDKTMETPIENEKIEKSNESENIDSENTEGDDEEKAKTIENVENVEMVENVEKVENVENMEKAENVEKSENVDDVKSKKVEVEEKFEKEESKKSELKNDGDEEVHDEADDIMNKIKEWYQEGNPFQIFQNDSHSIKTGVLLFAFFPMIFKQVCKASFLGEIGGTLIFFDFSAF
jgi:hypothetical protein